MTNSTPTTTHSNNKTRSSLIVRLRDLEDAGAWAEFVELYTPKIHLWACRLGINGTDADDVTQVVLLKIVKAIQEFRYEPNRGRFRGWLKTVTGNVVRDFERKANHGGRATGDTHSQNCLDALSDPVVVESLREMLERELQLELLIEAEERVRLRVKPANWEAWRLTTREGLPAADVAQRLGLKVSDVYVARTRITNSLREEVQKVEESY